jgi:hypothetical protein
MTNKVITALTSATTLAGTEVLPIVQSGATVKIASDDLTVKNIRSNATSGILQITGPAAASTRVVTVPNADWTAARTDAAQSFTGDQTLATGNLIQGTAAKGINFTANTPAAGMTSQLLNWYEEGTWTPVDASGAGLSISVTQALYVRIGRTVTINVFITYPATADATAASLGGLPFAVAGNNYPPITINTNSGVSIGAYANAGTQTISIVSGVNTSTNIINSVLSGKNVIMSGTYFI